MWVRVRAVDTCGKCELRGGGVATVVAISTAITSMNNGALTKFSFRIACKHNLRNDLVKGYIGSYSHHHIQSTNGTICNPVYLWQLWQRPKCLLPWHIHMFEQWTLTYAHKHHYTNWELKFTKSTRRSAHKHMQPTKAMIVWVFSMTISTISFGSPIEWHLFFLLFCHFIGNNQCKFNNVWFDLFTESEAAFLIECVFFIDAKRCCYAIWQMKNNPMKMFKLIKWSTTWWQSTLYHLYIWHFHYCIINTSSLVIDRSFISKSTQQFISKGTLILTFVAMQRHNVCVFSNFTTRIGIIPIMLFYIYKPNIFPATQPKLMISNTLRAKFDGEKQQQQE